MNIYYRNFRDEWLRRNSTELFGLLCRVFALKLLLHPEQTFVCIPETSYQKRDNVC